MLVLRRSYTSSTMMSNKDKLVCLPHGISCLFDELNQIFMMNIFHTLSIDGQNHIACKHLQNYLTVEDGKIVKQRERK